MDDTSLSDYRLDYKPQIPDALQEIEFISSFQNGKSAPVDREVLDFFPKTKDQTVVEFQRGFPQNHNHLKVAVVFSGGQAPGGHSVVAGVYDALKLLNAKSSLIGFLNGPKGILDSKYIEIDEKLINSYRHQGGFDLLGSGRDKIETVEQFEKADLTLRKLELDGLIIIGGDDSNTNAANLAEYFLAKGRKIKVVGVPKTIDGDLKNEQIEASFGFDTASKVYSNLIGNLMRDALSQRKYTFFVKLMGRSASQLLLECALKTHPNLAIVAEEVLEKKKSLKNIVDEIADLIEKRAQSGKNYGVILIPEGLIEFIPEIKVLIKEINALLAKSGFDEAMLSEPSRLVFKLLPPEIAKQLLLDRDPHGNVQVSKIETERLLIELVEKELKKRGFEGKFNPQPQFYGYEGRSALPSNFDVNYCYSLGLLAVLLVNFGHTGYIASIQNLKAPVHDWQIFGIPLVSMLHMEERKGRQVPVIKKALVDLSSPAFKRFEEMRGNWVLQDDYQFVGPIQFFGPALLTDATTAMLQL